MAYQYDDEQELLSLAQAGQTQAFEKLISRHRPWLRQTAKHITGDDILADDVCQRVCLVLLDKIPDFDLSRTIPLAAWLKQTTIRTSLHVLRSEGRRKRHEHQAGSQQLPTMTDELSYTAEDDAEFERLQRTIQSCLQELTDHQRDALIRRYWHGESVTSIATQQNCSRGAIQKRLQSGLLALRQKLNKQGVHAAALTCVYPLLAADINKLLAASTPTATTAMTTQTSSISWTTSIPLAATLLMGCGFWLALDETITGNRQQQVAAHTIAHQAVVDQQIHASTYELGHEIITAADGSFVSATTTTPPLGETRTSNIPFRSFLSQHDAHGQLQWRRPAPHGMINDMASTINGQILACSHGGLSCIRQADGHIIWSKKVGALLKGQAEAHAITASDQGAAYLATAGRLNSNGKGPGRNGMVARIDSKGSIVWKRKISNHLRTMLHQRLRLLGTANGGVVVSACEYTGPRKRSHMLVQHYDADGTVLWARHMPNQRRAFDLAHDSHTDDIIVLGRSLMRLNTDGDILWQNNLPSPPGAFWANGDVCIAPSGHIHVATTNNTGPEATMHIYTLEPDGTLLEHTRLPTTPKQTVAASLHLGDISTDPAGCLMILHASRPGQHSIDRMHLHLKGEQLMHGPAIPALQIRQY